MSVTAAIVSATTATDKNANEQIQDSNHGDMNDNDNNTNNNNKSQTVITIMTISKNPMDDYNDHHNKQ